MTIASADHEKDNEERRGMMSAIPDFIKSHLPADFVPQTRAEHKEWQETEARKDSQEIRQRMRASLEKNMSLKARTEPLCPAINPETARTAATFRTDPEDRPGDRAAQNDEGEGVKNEDTEDQMMVFPDDLELDR